MQPSLRERSRYVAANWAHDPKWSTFGAGAPDRDFNGFDAHELLGGAVLALPLPGHSRGHTAYALPTAAGWLLHAGDAFYHAGILGPDGRQSRAMGVFERLAAAQPDLIAANHRRLREVARRDDVTVVCTHEPALLDV